MGEVVHRIDAPCVAGAVVVRVANAVNHRIAHDDEGGGHVDFRTQHMRAFGEFARAHAAENIEALACRTVAVGRVLAGFVQLAALRADGVGVLRVNVGVTGFDQFFGELIELFKVVRGVVQMFFTIFVGPVKAEPVHHVFDRIHVFDGFFFGVGVVKTQVAAPAVALRQTEIQTNAFCVTDVQIAVRLGRKAGDDDWQGTTVGIRAIRIFACGGFRVDFLANEVGCDFGFNRIHGFVCYGGHNDFLLRCYALIDGMSANEISVRWFARVSAFALRSQTVRLASVLH